MLPSEKLSEVALKWYILMSSGVTYRLLLKNWGLMPQLIHKASMVTARPKSHSVREVSSKAGGPTSLHRTSFWLISILCTADWPSCKRWGFPFTSFRKYVIHEINTLSNHFHKRPFYIIAISGQRAESPRCAHATLLIEVKSAEVNSALSQSGNIRAQCSVI